MSELTRGCSQDDNGRPDWHRSSRDRPPASSQHSNRKLQHELARRAVDAAERGVVCECGEPVCTCEDVFARGMMETKSGEAGKLGEAGKHCLPRPPSHIPQTRHHHDDHDQSILDVICWPCLSSLSF